MRITRIPDLKKKPYYLILLYVWINCNNVIFDLYIGKIILDRCLYLHLDEYLIITFVQHWSREE